MLGAGINVNWDGVMVGEENAKFDEKRRFGKLAVGDKKGKDAEGRERRGGHKPSRGRGGETVSP